MHRKVTYHGIPLIIQFLYMITERRTGWHIVHVLAFLIVKVCFGLFASIECIHY